MPMTAGEISALLGGTVEGDASVQLCAVVPMDSASKGDLTYAADERYAGRLAHCQASAAIVGKAPATASMTLIRVPDVQASVAKLLGHLDVPEDVPPRGIHSSAVIAPDATIAGDAAIGPHVVIGARARIGAGTVICANVCIGADVTIGENCVVFNGAVVRSRCVIGRNVRLGPNCVIGWDGFGYYFANGVHHKIPHPGNVIIEDDVEIGACTCIDRAKFGSTRIGPGTKMDNLVQIGHNVQAGRGCLFCGQSGVAGSARLGNYVVMGGNSGVRDNISLGDGVQCSAFAAVAQDVEAGQTVVGVPAGPAREQYRVYQSLPKLPELLKKVKELEARLAAIESAKNH